MSFTVKFKTLLATMASTMTKMHLQSLFTAVILFFVRLQPYGGSVSAWSLFPRFRAHRRARKLQNTLVNRRTINEFEPTLPSDWEQSLERAIEAAIYAPNHKRTEPWRFHLLGPQAIQKVCQINADLVADAKGAAAGEKKLQRWLAMPGWLVVTCQYNGNDSMNDPMSLAREDYAACCCAIQNLCLSLHASGMGTKWTTGAVNFHPDFASAVGFSPNEEFVVGTLWFGTPVGEAPSPPKKKWQVKDVLVRHD